MPLLGTKKVIANMRRAAVGLGGRAEVGLKRGGLFLQRLSQKVVPVEFGILKNTANTRNVGGKGFNADIVVSYSTDYAVYVHENLDAQHKSGKQAKYLEAPARQNREEILRMIWSEAKL